MRIALIGSGGYIAQYLLKSFDNKDEVLKIDKQGEIELDLENVDTFDFEQLDGVDYVVFTAAISGPDMCAQQYDFCWNVNVVGTEKFIGQAIEKGCKIIFFSSDAVYGDIKGKVYDEYSEKQPDTPYGTMKKHVEDTFALEENFKAIRLSYVASPRDKFLSYCLKCSQTGEKAEVFHPFYRNCTVVSDVVGTVNWLMKNWNVCKEKYINVCGNELVSRLQMVDDLNDILSAKINYSIVEPPKEFFNNRPITTRIKSVVNEKYNIYNQNSFYEKIKKEMEENYE